MRSERDLKTGDIEKIFAARKPGSEEFFSEFSVLVPVVELDSGLHLLYEKRARHMKRQPGEICFPGGEMEDGETPCQCALRETWEEIGIPEESIRVVNQLDTIYTYGNFAMYCFLGIIEPDALDSIRMNSDEVEDILLISLDWLMENRPQVYDINVVADVPDDFPYDRVSGGVPYRWKTGYAPVPVYDTYRGDVLWGLTARITARFADAVENGMR